MKNLIFLFILLCLISCTETKSEVNEIPEYPHPEEIINHLSQQIAYECNDCIYDLDKTPDGYVLSLLDREDNSEIIADYLVWNSKTMEFQDFEIDETYLLQDINSNFDRIYMNCLTYKSNLYFGYDNANTDVITSLEDKQNKTNKELEQLARAYDALACSYVHPKWNIKNTVTADFKESNYAKIEKERIDQFIDYADKALATYQNLIDSDPNYETAVGSVKLKHANLCVHYYNSLSSVKENKLAENYIAQAKFPKEIIQFAKNALSICDQNSVLFSIGDNDSFPFWYLQEKENLRPDVLVLNENFLTLPYYITMLNEKSKLKTSISGSELFESELAYVLLSKNTDNVPLIELTNDIKNHLTDINNFHFESQYGGNYLLNYKDSSFSIKSNSGYLLTNEIMMFDIISSNPDRTIYFISNNYHKFEFDKNARQRSLVQEITTEQGELIDSISFPLMEKDIKNLNLESLINLGGMSSAVTASILMGMISLDDTSQYRTDLYLQMIEQVSVEQLIDNNLLNNVLHYMYCKPTNIANLQFSQIDMNQKLADKIDLMNISEDNFSEKIDDIAVIDKILKFNYYKQADKSVAIHETKVGKKLIQKLQTLKSEPWMKNMIYSNRKIADILKTYDL